MSLADDLRTKALKIPTMRWFRAVAPKVLPPMHRAMAKISGGKFHPGATIVLTTKGAKSGKQRETPLEAIRRSDGSFVVIASNFAQEHHPAWSYNLLADPSVHVLYDGERRAMVAALLEGDARAEAWLEAIDHMPIWRDYIEITDRPFRIFHLTPL